MLQPGTALGRRRCLCEWLRCFGGSLLVRLLWLWLLLLHLRLLKQLLSGRLLEVMCLWVPLCTATHQSKHLFETIVAKVINIPVWVLPTSFQISQLLPGLSAGHSGTCAHFVDAQEHASPGCQAHGRRHLLLSELRLLRLALPGRLLRDHGRELRVVGLVQMPRHREACRLRRLHPFNTSDSVSPQSHEPPTTLLVRSLHMSVTCSKLVCL